MADMYEFERALHNYELKQKAHELDIAFIKQESQSRDIEQEACLRVVSERLDRMGNEVEQLKKDVRQDIQNIRNDVNNSIADIKQTIPTLFDNAINKLFSRVFKWMMVGLGIILLLSIFLFTKPLILQGIDNIKTYVEKKEELK